MRAGFQSHARSQQGVALVITLLMLVLITVMAVAFLLLSQRETASVGALHSTTDAELAADAALERSKAIILSPFVKADSGVNEVMGPDLFVSLADTRWTNYTAPTWTGPVNTNVSPPVFVTSPNELLTNRFFLDLNRNGRFEPSGLLHNFDDTGSTNGNPIEWRIGDPMWIGLLQDPTLPHARNNRFIARYAYLVQPIGRSLDLNWIHNDAVDRSPAIGYFRNQGVGPWEMNLAGFLADVNRNLWGTNQGQGQYIYSVDWNQLNNPLKGFAFEDASWLLNNRFAGARGNLMSVQRLFGVAGDMALTNDYVDSYCNGPVLPWNLDVSQFANANILDNLQPYIPARPWPGADSPRHYFSLHDFFDRNKFPDPDPMFQPVNFRKRLSDASAKVNSYDRYTFYRMLAQLGVESAAEKEDQSPDQKINLNYINVGGVRASQFVSWTTNDLTQVPGWTNGFLAKYAPNGTGPELWMNVVIQRMLRDYGYYDLAFNNVVNLPLKIPIYTNIPGTMPLTRTASFRRGNESFPNYSPHIHQIVQLAANILESTSAQKANGVATYPYNSLVFRPVFKSESDELFIVRYEQVGDLPGKNMRAQIGLPLPNGMPTPPLYVWHNIADESDRPSSGNWFDQNASFYDVPWIFGARKNIPNFNELSVQSHVLFKRYLLVKKPNKDETDLYKMNISQALIVSLTNYQFTELSYPYTNFYPRPLIAYVTNRMVATLLTNQPPVSTNPSALFSVLSAPPALPGTTPTIMGTYFPAGWGPDFGTNYRLNLDSERSSFPSARIDSKKGLLPLTSPLEFDDSIDALRYTWRIVISNQYRYYLFDGATPNPVLLDSFTSARANLDLVVNPTLDRGLAATYQMWDTRAGVTRSDWTRGIEHQLEIARGNPEIIVPGIWENYAGFDQFLSKDKLIDGFKAWLADPNAPSLTYVVPFSTSRRVIHAGRWDVNDPLVHYTISDLNGTNYAERVDYGEKDPRLNKAVKSVGSTLGEPNNSYLPWARGAANPFTVGERDPVVLMPDSWEFPSFFAASKYPNQGWLGRVHRGTPWQTAYFKSEDPNLLLPDVPGDPMDALLKWRKDVGLAYLGENYPTNDWRLLDIFTTAVYPNSTKGRLSINQTNPAAWSAVLSGVGVTAAADPDVNGEVFPVEEVIEPFSSDAVTLTTNAAIFQLVERMNALRDSLAVPPANGGRGIAQFNKLSDLLSRDFLTLGSPFLKQPYISAAAESTKGTKEWLLTDADYERIPQQIAGLIKVGEPRFVVYAWGQSLKPAGNVPGIGFGIDTSTQTPRNYQVTGEQAMRAVVKVEFENLYDGTGKLTGRRPRAVIESFNIIPND